MKILFMGSAGFAAPSFEALVNSRHRVLEAITQPDKPAGRGMKQTSCPLAELARLKKIPVYQPPKLKEQNTINHISALGPDLIVVVAYGKLLPRTILTIPCKGAINLHASLLPKYRGAAPINWAIANGETETGVTTQLIAEELDAGDVLLSCRTHIDETETALQLHDRLALMGADLLLKTIDGVEKGTVKPSPQDHSQAMYAPILKKENGHIDWSLPAKTIYNRIRGFCPWPGCFTFLDGKNLKIYDAAPTDKNQEAPPGTIVESDKSLAVACGKGTLYLLEVQLEGKRKMPAVDFLRGHKIKQGVILQ